MSSSEQSPPPASARWLAIVGIGEDGGVGLGETARRLIADAEVVFGGRRHLALAGNLVRGEARPWPKPFDAAMVEVLALRGRRVCVLASGDPFLHGVGATLSRHVPAQEMDVVPAPSAFSLAAARLGWSLPEAETISLHGKPVALLLPFLHPGRRILALTSDASGPAAIAGLLRAEGFGKSRLTLLEALGGSAERISGWTADGFMPDEVDPLNLVGIEVEAGAGARVIPLAAGRDDDLFEHDGQITKREIRAMTLSALAPRRGELLWDIGAGSGSVAIEWLLSDASLRAVAIEADATRAARIARNAERFGVASLRVVEARAPAALDDLPRPDAIFVGGGGSRDGLMQMAIEALRPGGRLVANAVTLAMEAVLIDMHGRLGGSLSRIAVQRAESIGGMSAWRPAMPVTQWAWSKPVGETE